MKQQCHLCPKSFQSPKDLEKHMMKIHGLSVAHIKKPTKEEQTEFIKQCVGMLERLK